LGQGDYHSIADANHNLEGATMSEAMTTAATQIERKLTMVANEPRLRTQRTVYVVLPAYNEQTPLGALLESIRATLSGAACAYAVIVVDDGSRDATALVASKATFLMPVELVEHRVNRGLAAAIRTGLTAALDRCGPDDVVVTMDADNTQPPKLIPAMMAKIDEGFDVVIASRFQPGAKVHGVPRSRQLYSVGARFLFRAMFPIRGVRDYTCGYRAYRASALRQATKVYGTQLISETGFSCMADLLLKLQRLSLRMAEVPLELHYERRGADSKMQVGRTIRQTMSLLVRRRIGRL
jgi:dolichol-phosphate mannosyltransferase